MNKPFRYTLYVIMATGAMSVILSTVILFLLNDEVLEKKINLNKERTALKILMLDHKYAKK